MKRELEPIGRFLNSRPVTIARNSIIYRGLSADSVIIQGVLDGFSITLAWKTSVLPNMVFIPAALAVSRVIAIGWDLLSKQEPD